MCVAVMHEGKLVELGTHSELMSSGRYAEMYRTQAEGYRDDPVSPCGHILRELLADHSRPCAAVMVDADPPDTPRTHEHQAADDRRPPGQQRCERHVAGPAHDRRRWEEPKQG